MLTAAESRAFQRKLQEMSARLQGDRSQLESESLDRQIKEGVAPELQQADERLGTSEQAVTLSLLANEELLIDEINAALARIDDGSFGRCEECGRAIRKDRLRALPYVRYCAKCAEKRDSQTSP